MTVSDYIIDYLRSLGIKHVFLITGGAIAFLIDAFHGRKDIEYICVAHEQAGAMAAEAYSRVGPGIGAAMATSGPGATNLITGICCAWFDSIPTLYITGQVNTYEQKGSSGVRQIGFQETDVVSVIKPITKLALQLDKVENIRYLLEKATYIAKMGRPGPVLLDVPQNFQRVKIDPRKLKSFTPPKEVPHEDTNLILEKKVKKSITLIKKAKRPIMIIGAGIRLANAEREMKKVVTALGIPIVKTWGGFDLLASDNPLLIGTAGVYGNRGANFAVQNADLVLSIGARLDTRLTGGRPETFAREAKKIVIDIDQSELNKNRGLVADIKVNADAKLFLQELYRQIKNLKKINISSWAQKCNEWKHKYPAVLPEYYKEKKRVNAYVFIKTLSEELYKNAIIIPDDGGHLVWTMQAFELKEGQRLFSAFGNSPMGYAFPASIGASFALSKKEVICIDGDGSIQINIQEFETIVRHKLPVKIFILNNNGYAILQQFQEGYLDGHIVASSPNSGYSAPDFLKIAKAYGIKAISIDNHKELRKKIKQVLLHTGPVVCDVKINTNQRLIPKLEFGQPIEDLSPYLDRKEFLSNMIVKPLKESLEIIPGL